MPNLLFAIPLAGSALLAARWRATGVAVAASAAAFAAIQIVYGRVDSLELVYNLSGAGVMQVPT